MAHTVSSASKQQLLIQDQLDQTFFELWHILAIILKSRLKPQVAEFVDSFEFTLSVLLWLHHW
jgi:hypothetical protein